MSYHYATNGDSHPERSSDLWDRANIARAYALIGSRFHRGQWSKGYRKLCQAHRILDDLDFRYGAEGNRDDEDDEIRALAAEILWKRRHDVMREW